MPRPEGVHTQAGRQDHGYDQQEKDFLFGNYISKVFHFQTCLCNRIQTFSQQTSIKCKSNDTHFIKIILSATAIDKTSNSFIFLFLCNTAEKGK
jgi:hypothetical protein